MPLTQKPLQPAQPDQVRLASRNYEFVNDFDQVAQAFGGDARAVDDRRARVALRKRQLRLESAPDDAERFPDSPVEQGGRELFRDTAVMGVGNGRRVA